MTKEREKQKVLSLPLSSSFLISPTCLSPFPVINISSQAVADANRQKAVLEIKIEENIIEVEGKKNVSLINNEILQVFSFFTLYGKLYFILFILISWQL